MVEQICKSGTQKAKNRFKFKVNLGYLVPGQQKLHSQTLSQNRQTHDPKNWVWVLRCDLVAENLLTMWEALDPILSTGSEENHTCT